jgi:hypothetical protein
VALWWKTWRKPCKKNRWFGLGAAFISKWHTKGLLLECKEDSVDKLDVFEVIVDHIVEFEPLFIVANGDERKAKWADQKH